MKSLYLFVRCNVLRFAHGWFVFYPSCCITTGFASVCMADLAAVWMEIFGAQSVSQPAAFVCSIPSNSPVPYARLHAASEGLVPPLLGADNSIALSSDPQFVACLGPDVQHPTDNTSNPYNQGPAGYVGYFA